MLFEGGVGEIVRRNLLKECVLHTLLHLPTGLFDARGAKANVLCFDRKPGADTPWAKTLWVYDLLRSALARIEDVLGDLEQRLRARDPEAENVSGNWSP